MVFSVLFLFLQRRYFSPTASIGIKCKLSVTQIQWWRLLANFWTANSDFPDWGVGNTDAHCRLLKEHEQSKTMKTTGSYFYTIITMPWFYHSCVAHGLKWVWHPWLSNNLHSSRPNASTLLFLRFFNDLTLRKEEKHHRCPLTYFTNKLYQAQTNWP